MELDQEQLQAGKAAGADQEQLTRSAVNGSLSSDASRRLSSIHGPDGLEVQKHESLAPEHEAASCDLTAADH